jgi:hypothetical protein
VGGSRHRRRVRGDVLSETDVRELYGVEPDRFIEARDRLARELRAAGQDDDAAAVKKLRKPSVVAWALNAGAREAPGDVDAVLEAGEELRRAQRKALSNAGTEDLFRATEARKHAVRALADRAVAALGVRGETHRDRIVSTLEAASLDRELGQRLRDGMLDRDAQPTTGFGAIEGFELLQGGASETATSPGESAEERRERAREAKEAEREAVRAGRAAEQASARAADLRAKAGVAESAAREAEAEAKRLADEAKTARKRADRASRD